MCDCLKNEEEAREKNKKFKFDHMMMYGSECDSSMICH